MKKIVPEICPVAYCQGYFEYGITSQLSDRMMRDAGDRLPIDKVMATSEKRTEMLRKDWARGRVPHHKRKDRLLPV